MDLEVSSNKEKLSSAKEKRFHHIPTIQDIINDRLTKISLKYWVQSSVGDSSLKPYSAEIIESIYRDELDKENPISRVMVLELSLYLEKYEDKLIAFFGYLWPNYKYMESSFFHLMSIMIMVNEKARESVSLWSMLNFLFRFLLESLKCIITNVFSIIDCFNSDIPRFNQLFVELLAVGIGNGHSLSYKEKTIFTLFMTNVFQSISNPLIEPLALRLVTLPIWINLSDKKRREYFKDFPKIKEAWKAVEKRYKKLYGKRTLEIDFNDSLCLKSSSIPAVYERYFLVVMIHQFLDSLLKNQPECHQVQQEDDTAENKSQMNALESKSIKSSQDVSSNDYQDNTSPKNNADYKKKGLISKFCVSFVRYCERMVEFLIELLSQLSTRRFFGPVFQYLHVLIRIKKSSLYTHAQGELFAKLVSILHFYQDFEINNFSGLALSDLDMVKKHYEIIQNAQKIAWKLFQPELRKFAFANISSLDKGRDCIEKWFEPLSDEKLKEFCESINLISQWDVFANQINETDRQNEINHIDDKKYSKNSYGAFTCTRDDLLDYITEYFEKRVSQLEIINSKSLFPDEKLLWDSSLIPSSNYDGSTPLALPRLNLQFLTFHDYLMRCFTLYMLETTDEVRNDIEEAVKYLQPHIASDGTILNRGWARMALPIDKIRIASVVKPFLGETIPQKVICEINYTLPPKNPPLAAEWDALRVHACVFLLSFHPNSNEKNSYGEDENNSKRKKHPSSIKNNHIDPSSKCESNSMSKYGICVRGGEIIEILDENGQIISQDYQPGDTNSVQKSGLLRTLRISLDPAQYHQDILDGIAPDNYQQYSVLLRRNAKENNFRSVLSTTRDLMNSHFVVPNWLEDVFLGYGKPASISVINSLSKIDLFDTFLDIDHIKSSFPQFEKIELEPQNACPPYTLEFQENLLKVTQSVNTRKFIGNKLEKMIQSIIYSGKLTIDSDPLKLGATSAHTLNKEKTPKEMEIDNNDNNNNNNNNNNIPINCDKDNASITNSQDINSCQPKYLGNSIRFTSTQVNAILKAQRKGLTLVVGPPGTGKTDLAVQIISDWYHTLRDERTLIVTHSNTALNQIFEKIVSLDIHEKHLLRLGHGGEQLNTEQDFTKSGRVDYMLRRRIALLNLVLELAQSLNINSEVAYSVETALHFFRIVIVSKWEGFLVDLEKLVSSDKKSQEMFENNTGVHDKNINSYEFSNYQVRENNNNNNDNNMDSSSSNNNNNSYKNDKNSIQNIFANFRKFNSEYFFNYSKFSGVSPVQILDTFPFKRFFDSNFNNFVLDSVESCLKSIEICWNYILEFFENLDDCRPFEILRDYSDRGNYLLTVQARIVAMTCTHAALKRSELVKLGFQYDNLLMEEAAQILEIETFIPMLLQDNLPSSTESRLKRVVLIGDHNQLPPVVQNQAFQRYSHLDQSLFTRFIRFGVPHITLDAQGRSRPSIAELYSWRYSGLKNLEHVIEDPLFKSANPGFAYTYQFVDVAEGSEIEPTPYFYQNLVEAQFVVATFVYMRMLGYPANKISIITSYNGQKHLIRDVLKTHCSKDPRIGSPGKVTTLDRYQGQQNDYILLSLVRTKFIGHIRDVRRWIVGLSRARLGLYIFGKLDLFKDCYELTPTFSKLLKIPTKLCLVPNEYYGRCQRQASEIPNDVLQVENLINMGQIILPSSVQILNMKNVRNEKGSNSNNNNNNNINEDKNSRTNFNDYDNEKNNSLNNLTESVSENINIESNNGQNDEL